jgi:hypothetical protein
MSPIEIHGYAIVSDDDMIADATDQVPPSLRNEKDWEQYQAAQARSALVVFARISHQFEPNTRGDPRLVLSRTAKGLESRQDAWWWNPVETPWNAVAEKLLARGGEVAVGGGQSAFDLFMGLGFDVFHLARARGVKLPGGRKVFSLCEGGLSAEAVLEKHGLRHAERIEVDPAQGIEMNIWRKG